MNRQELVDAIAVKADISKKDADAAVKAAANPEETIRNIYTKALDQEGFKVYARHPYCYRFRY